MNHAPLLARVPFCFQARKWCPPIQESVAIAGKEMLGHAAHLRNFPNRSPLLGRSSTASLRTVEPSYRCRLQDLRRAYCPGECPNTLRSIRSTCRSRGLLRTVNCVLREEDRLRVLLKSFVGEDIGVRKGGDNDVQRLADVWGPVVGILHPKECR